MCKGRRVDHERRVPREVAHDDEGGIAEAVRRSIELIGGLEDIFKPGI